ncbi:MAG: hypothetical protein HWD83_04215 [Gammaproteobacteria bacterium]|nr:hypothetical protein [Gammaproteobacteria bacterium]
MKKIRLTGVIALILLGWISIAKVGHAFHISETTCTNSCVITQENGVITIRDCCGGQVRTVFFPHLNEEAPSDP